jgi:hypothetical protein
MSFSLFKLAPSGSRDGVSCSADGAFIGSVALLKRVNANGAESWTPRDANAISRDLSRSLGLPIDVSSKASCFKAIAVALNAGDIARAQTLTLFLRFPDAAPLTKAKPDRTELFRFVDLLIEGGFVKAVQSSGKFAKFNPNHWPAGAPDSQGGEFAPKGTGVTGPNLDLDGAPNEVPSDQILTDREDDNLRNDSVYRPTMEAVTPEQIGSRQSPGSANTQSRNTKPVPRNYGFLEAMVAAVFGKPQNATHKPMDPHEFASCVWGEHRKKRPGVTKIWYHSTLRRISNGAIDSGKLPDVATVAEDGTITPYEILSPGQTADDMKVKYKGISAKPGSLYRLARVQVVTREAAWALPEAAFVAESITEGEVGEGALRLEDVMHELDDATDEEQ